MKQFNITGCDFDGSPFLCDWQLSTANTFVQTPDGSNSKYHSFFLNISHMKLCYLILICLGSDQEFETVNKLCQISFDEMINLCTVDIICSNESPISMASDMVTLRKSFAPALGGRCFR